MKGAAAKAVLGSLLAGAIVLTASVAAAQSTAPAQGKPAQNTASPQTKPQPATQGFFATIGSWFDQTTDNFNSGVRTIRDRFQNFGQQATVAAKSTVDTAKDAADAVGRLPNTRVVRGREKCQIAPNGAPDCIAAAYSICQAKGFKTGKSVDMTTAEVCPADVYLAGRNSGPECRTETFVSRVVCQ
jgi:hypothetical protein